MSYRCKFCDTVVPAGKPRLVYAVKRADGQIAAEIPSCFDCLKSIEEGRIPVDFVPVETPPAPKPIRVVRPPRQISERERARLLDERRGD